MQASGTWEPPKGTLGRILDATRERITTLEDKGLGGPSVAMLKPVEGRRSIEPPSLKAALRRDAVAVIAELKRQSPSKGVMNATLDAATQTQTFERGGASAISILTEPMFFGGTRDDVIDAARATSLPLLKKDFHIHPLQLLEATYVEASAVLLIARAVRLEDLLTLMSAAKTWRLEAVIEVRTERELEDALEAGAEMIGVNSRDLETLEVDERVPARLMPRIPANVIGIWESGVRTVDDVRRAADAGADAVLVGSALSRSPDPERLVRSLTGVPRSARHG